MLLGKTIVVTGISSGIGARIGELALALGADVIGLDVNAPASPLGAFIRVDIASPSAIAEVPRDVAAAHRRAVQRRRRLRDRRRRTRRWRSISTGLRALSEALAPRLREGGAVVNVASIAGYGWRANLERAKAFVVGARLSRHRRPHRRASRFPTSRAIPCRRSFCCCGRCGPRISPCSRSAAIRVNAVSPGPVTTPILKEFREVFGDPRVDEDIARVGRAGAAADIAPAALFLCSDGARWINGANLPVDGGLEASINASVLGF